MVSVESAVCAGPEHPLGNGRVLEQTLVWGFEEITSNGFEVPLEEKKEREKECKSQHGAVSGHIFKACFILSN